MSLFPAYSDVPAGVASTSSSKDDSKVVEASSWLTNSSYDANVSSRITVARLSSESSDETLSDGLYSEKHPPLRTDVAANVDISTPGSKRSRRVKRRKKEKRKHTHDKAKTKRGYEPDVENVYFEDKHRDWGNNTVNTLCSRARPLYDLASKPIGFVSRKLPKKEACERYYAKNLDTLEKLKKKDTVIKRETTKDALPEEEPPCSWSINLEELQKSKVKEYNEKLLQEANNVPLWIEYIEFQDTLTSLQKYQLTKDTHRATIVKKLSIVEKAMEKNPESLDLLQLKLSLMGELLPADQFSNELEGMINKDSGNDILWKTYIMTTQGSVAMCTVPRVLELYSKCFCTLKQRARTNPRIYDERLLQMLYWCLTFLRHTGLWEQMWETIRLNLNLNLSLKKNSLSFQKTIDEKKLIGMEEVILMSRLPLNQLWQRTESLRENCHWISVSRDELELVGDSRRFILPEDVADFVHPILSRNSNFRMAIHSLLSLKVPLLPTRDCMLRELTLKEFEWGADSSEVLLPFLYPSVGEMAGHAQRKELFNGILEGRLTSGPQYLMFHPAQESYLDFIREIFRTIAENLPPAQRTSIYIWWLRFERLLVFVHKEDPLKYDNKGKKLKATLKEFLKKEENRNNLHFYREYALIEREMGRFENCVNILRTAIQSQGTCPSAIANIEERAGLVSLYRTFFETLLNSETYKDEHRAQIIAVMEQMVPGKQADQLSLVESYLEKCVESFLQEIPTEDERDTFFWPNYKCDTIACYAYLLYTKNLGIAEAMDVFQRCIGHYKENPHLQEMLYESQMTLLQLHCERTQEMHILAEPLNEMLSAYPDNFFGLSILAYVKSELPIWKLNSQGTRTGLWRAIAMCLGSRRRIHLLNKIEDSVGATAAINKLVSFHQTLARVPTTKCCPLLWRLYMLLLREYNLCEKKGEEVYHESVGHCPWARSIYIDAAEIAPQVLTQIQDVIREKELRMHVTPEELDILRG